MIGQGIAEFILANGRIIMTVPHAASIPATMNDFCFHDMINVAAESTTTPWLYGRAFKDLDGHIWETFYSDLNAAPEEMKKKGGM